MRNVTYILLILNFLSCKKNNDVYKESLSYIDSTLKNQYLFQDGSYWVYQDQLMNIDSIVLLNSDSGLTSICPDNGCERNEFAIMNFKNISHNISFNLYLLSNFIRYNGGGQWGQNGQPIFILNSNEGNGFNGLSVGEHYDSIVVLSNTYFDVTKMLVSANNQVQKEFEYDIDLFFAPYIGIIKVIEFDTINGTRTMELKNYNIY